MTLGDIGQWLFRMVTAAANARTLVGNNTARVVLLYMGYVQSNSHWWTPEPSRDTTLTRLYCENGIRTAPAHPRGKMFQRLRGLDSVHSGYLTRGQLLALVAHSDKWANRYLDPENSPQFQFPPLPSSSLT